MIYPALYTGRAGFLLSERIFARNRTELNKSEYSKKNHEYITKNNRIDPISYTSVTVE